MLSVAVYHCISAYSTLYMTVQLCVSKQLILRPTILTIVQNPIVSLIHLFAREKSIKSGQRENEQQ